MNTLTVDTRAAPGGSPLKRAVLDIFTRLQLRARVAPSLRQRQASALLARANAYETTQPGFAADLRAAAWRALDAS